MKCNELSTLLDIFLYLNARAIPIKKYVVDDSELKNSSIRPEIKKNIEQIKTYLENGDSSINNPRYKYMPAIQHILKGSHVFKDWLFHTDKVIHFHLPSNNKRTNHLLFVYLDVINNKVLFLGIADHQLFRNQSCREKILLKIPQSIQNQRKKYMNLKVDDGDGWTEEEAEEIRKAGGNPLANDHNGVFFDLSTTITTTGITLDSVDVTSRAKEMLQNLYLNSYLISEINWQELTTFLLKKREEHFYN